MNKKKAYAVATAHLDTVWRWSLAKSINEFIPDTIEKNFDLIEKYPEYKFNFEGAYRYEIIEKFYPKAFEKIGEYIKDGRWFVSGTAYENGDANIPSPEALIRNILIGDNYFKTKFGVSSKDLFMPDCFGFGWALPSVANHCSLLGLTTQKLSWGGAYGLPQDLGTWKGPDGCSIYTAINARSYRYKFTGDLRADISIIDRIMDNSNRADLPWSNHLYGTGDWGGSPTEESVINVCKSVKANSDNEDFEIISAASDDIFYAMDKLTDEQKSRLPEWNNELLMTSHGAGCYTSRDQSKRLNYLCERNAAIAEPLCCYAHYQGVYDYPKENLLSAWKKVVRHQFHDDITGTSTMDVYNESWNDYYSALSHFRNEIEGASKLIAKSINTSWAKSDYKAGVVLIYNPTQFHRKESVILTVKTERNCEFIEAYDKSGKEVLCQLIKKSGKELTISILADVKPYSFAGYEIRKAKMNKGLTSDLKVTEHTLENRKYKVKLNKNGDIAYIFDKELGRQILKAPIKLALIRETGALNYPSWEITKEDIDREPYCYANTPTFTIVENGPVSIAIKVEREAEYSKVSQTIRLGAGDEFIRVENNIEWNTRRTLLKAVFPFEAENEIATYDLGLGVIKRGSNADNLYEVPAQRWADITDASGEFGVSVFSDSKYGWDKPNNNTLRLTILHTPTGAFTKDARQDLQDIGRCCCSFAIYSHKNGFENATQINSTKFALPLLPIQSRTKSCNEIPLDESMLEINSDDVLVRAVKMCENDSSLIVRVNEANGKRVTNASMTLFKSIESVQLVNGCEEVIKDIGFKGNKLHFNLNPFEIRTFKITLKDVESRRNRLDVEMIPLEFNAKGFTAPNEEMRHTILQGSGLSLPNELVKPIINVSGVDFALPQKIGDRYDVLVCDGQKINLPEHVQRICILLASTIDEQEIEIKTNKIPNKLTAYKINDPIQTSDMYGLNQVGKVIEGKKLGFEFEYTHHPEGVQPQSAVFYMYDLFGMDKTSIVLPENSKIVVLAISVIKEINNTRVATPLYDEIMTQPYKFGEIPPIDKILEMTDAVTIRAGKIQDQVKGGKGKGFKRDNIITNIIRSYTKSEW